MITGSKIKIGFFAICVASCYASIHAAQAPPSQVKDGGVPNISTRTTHTNVAIFADLLIWNAQESGTENWGQVLNVNTPDGTIDILDVDFDWDVGFRVGIGYGMRHDLWDTQLSYTRFCTDGDKHVHSENPIASSFIGNFFIDNLAAIALSGPQYHRASIRWSLDFNMFDWELGRKFWVSKALSIRPFLGLKGGWIDQKIHSKWIDPTSGIFHKAKENLDNDFWGIGPSAGLKTLWKLWHSESAMFSLFGDFSGAIQWGEWSFKDIYRNDFPDVFHIKEAKNKSGASTFDIFMGFEWQKSWNHHRSHFFCRLGYETQSWFDQLQFYSFNMGRLSNLLTFQGVTIDARIEF